MVNISEIYLEERRLERLEQESEREYDDCEDEEDTHPQMGER